MGIQDREYYRETDDRSGLHFGSRLSMVTKLIILNAALFLLNSLIGRDDWLTRMLSATPEDVARPWLWWRLLTSGFVHSPLGITHILFNMFGLWMFGRKVEWRYGSGEFLRIYLLAVCVGSLIWCLRMYTIGATNAMLLGASGAVTAVILLYAFNFPHDTVLLMFVLPIPAWLFGLLVIGGNIWSLIDASGADNVAYDVHLVGAALAIVYFRFGWNLSLLSLPGWTRLRSSRPRKPALRVLRDEDEPVDEEPTGNLDQEADRLLAKVSRQGLDSLTADERAFLERYSRLVRTRRG
jgi:membrane associated rhomboid family serine protease